MSINILSQNGQMVRKPTLTAAFTDADTAGKTVVITGAVTASTMNTGGRSLEIKQGGVITVPDGATLTINGPFQCGLFQCFDGAGTVSFGAGSVAEVYPEWWGAIGGESNSAITTIAMALAFNTDKPVCFEDGVTYYLNNTITINNWGFQFAGFFSLGRATIQASSSFPSGVPLIRIEGGSGKLLASEIKNIDFIGRSQATIGLEFASPCGITYRDCRFRQHSIAVKLSNDLTGSFTEKIIGEKCCILECLTALKYYRTIGTSSFHGSGFVNTWITPVPGNSPIVIGSECMPYNAPMFINCFSAGETTPIFLTEGTLSNGNINFKGVISFEGDPTLVSGGTRPIYFAGDVTSLGAINFGTFYLVYSVHNTGPFAGNIFAVPHLKPRRVERPFSAGTPMILCVVGEKVHAQILLSDGTFIAFETSCFTDNVGALTHYSTPIIYLGDLSLSPLAISGSSLTMKASLSGTAYCHIEPFGLNWAVLPPSNKLEYKE